MPITHNIKSPVTLAAADITEAEIANNAVSENKIANNAITENKIANSAVTDNKVNFTSSIAVGNSTVNTTINTTSVSVDSTVVSNGSIAVGNSTVNTTITNHSIDTYAPITNKNLIINGGMDLWQRSTSITAAATGYKGVDRFQHSRNGSGEYTQSRSTDVPSGQGFSYSMRLDVLTAFTSPSTSNYTMFMQKIEGQNLQHLLKGTSNAKKLTLSFWVKSNKTGTYHARLSDANNSRHTSKSYTIDSSNTWEKKTITYDGDTTGTLLNNSNSSLELQMWLSAGSGYTSGTLATSWQSAINANVAPGQTNLLDSTSNVFYITGIQLEIGEQATGFEFEPFETIQRKCHRYFVMMGGEAVYERFGDGIVRNSTQAFITIFLLTRMRSAPTVSLNSNGNFRLDDSTGRTVNGLSMDLPSSYAPHCIITCSGGMTQGRGCQFMANATTNARISISAELN